MSIADEIQKLQDLHSNGTLTDDEFAKAKAKILGQEPAPASPQLASEPARTAGSIGCVVAFIVMISICGGGCYYAYVKVSEFTNKAKEIVEELYPEQIDLSQNFDPKFNKGPLNHEIVLKNKTGKKLTTVSVTLTIRKNDGTSTKKDFELGDFAPNETKSLAFPSPGFGFSSFDCDIWGSGYWLVGPASDKSKRVSFRGTLQIKQGF